MTDPSRPRPVPGPPRPGPVPQPPRPGAAGGPAGPPAAEDAPPEPRWADLGQRPVAEHVAVYEAEHARLQRELGTIDQL